jgi:AraC-like DNA-binding protein/cbb3-type cytochrome oxidase subunit 3
MKRFVIFILCSLLTFFTYAGVIPYPGLREKIAHNPESSLLLLDSLEEKGAIPQYGIDYLRALSYRTQSRYYMCMYYATHALNNPEIQRDSVLTSYTYMLLAESSVASFQLAEAADMITKGKEYAEKANDQLLRANMLQMEGGLYRNMGVLNKSYECLQEAVSLLSDISNAEAKFLLSHCMGYLMGYYISDRKPQKAWEVGLQRERLLRSLESRTDVDVHVLDRHKGFFYSKMAYLSYQVKKPQMAKKYADMFYSTVFSTTSMGQLEINDFLLESGDYHSVLVHSKAYFSELDASDSLNVIYLRTLYQSGKAYSALGKYSDAYNAMMQAYDIRNKMRVNMERNQIFDLTDVTDAVSREYELEKAAYRVQMQHRIIIGLVGIMAFLLLLFGGLWRALTVIKRKNRKMAELILELDDQRNKLMPKYSFPQLEMTADAGERKLPQEADTAAGTDTDTDTEPETSDTSVSENEGLFLKFDQQVKEQKLYLNYKLTRDDYAHLMGVDRNRFASILKLFTAGGNLSCYLNDLRLEYSIGLFRNHPDWPISKVATESALPSLSTFYRLFKDKYGISPNSFRKTVLR